MIKKKEGKLEEDSKKPSPRNQIPILDLTKMFNWASWIFNGINFWLKCEPDSDSSDGPFENPYAAYSLKNLKREKRRQVQERNASTVPNSGSTLTASSSSNYGRDNTALQSMAPSRTSIWASSGSQWPAMGMWKGVEAEQIQHGGNPFR